MPNHKGWPLYHRLVVLLLSFLSPFLTRVQLTETIRLLYKVLCTTFVEKCASRSGSSSDCVLGRTFRRNCCISGVVDSWRYYVKDGLLHCEREGQNHGTLC